MKKILLFLALILLMSSCSQKTYQPMIKKQEVPNLRLFKLNKATMENKNFKNDLNSLNYYISEQLTITPESFEPYIDIEKGIIVLPSVQFILKKGAKPPYSSPEEWKDKNGQIYNGYVFDTNSDSKDGSNPRLMFIEGESSQNKNQILYLSLIEYKGERYKLKSNFTTSLDCGIEKKIETITIE